MGDPGLELVWFPVPVNPAPIQLHESPQALHQLFRVKAGHVEMQSRFEQVPHVIFNPEPLQLASLPALNHREGLVDGDTVVERRGRRLNSQRTMGYYLGRVPPILFIPVDSEHVVGEVLSVLKLTLAWLDLAHVDLAHTEVSRSKRCLGHSLVGLRSRETAPEYSVQHLRTRESLR